MQVGSSYMNNRFTIKKDVLNSRKIRQTFLQDIAAQATGAIYHDAKFIKHFAFTL